MEIVQPSVEVDGDVAAKAVTDLGRVTVLEQLAQPATANITPSMTWQSAWTNKEDR